MEEGGPAGTAWPWPEHTRAVDGLAGGPSLGAGFRECPRPQSISALWARAISLQLPIWDGWQQGIVIGLQGGMGAGCGEEPGGRRVGSARRQGMGDRVGAEAT